jgi:hypothetical protein
MWVSAHTPAPTAPKPPQLVVDVDFQPVGKSRIDAPQVMSQGRCARGVVLRLASETWSGADPMPPSLARGPVDAAAGPAGLLPYPACALSASRPVSADEASRRASSDTAAVRKGQMYWLDAPANGLTAGEPRGTALPYGRRL